VAPLRFLFASSLALGPGRVPDPQLALQLRQQSFELAFVSTGLHTHTHLLSCSPQSTMELLRLRRMYRSFFQEFSPRGIQERYLLKFGVEI
jgi:hypothetical protein